MALRRPRSNTQDDVLEAMLHLSSPLAPKGRRLRAGHPEQASLLSPIFPVRGKSASAASAAGGAGGDGDGDGDDDAAGTTSEGLSSPLQATMNSVNLLLGVGVLSLPYALKASGWAIGMGLLFFLTVLTNFTGKILGRLMRSDPALRSFPDIGQAAMGRTGRWLVSLMFFGELLAACGMYLILSVDNITKLFPTWPRLYLIIAFTAIVLPSTWTTRLAILSYFSIVGVLASSFLFFVLLYKGFTAVPLAGPAPSPHNHTTNWTTATTAAAAAAAMVQGTNGSGATTNSTTPPAQPAQHWYGSILHPQETALVTGPDQFPIAIGLMMVGFAGHAAFPSVYGSLKDKRKYNCVLDSAYVFVAVFNAVIAAAGYLMYGNRTEQEVTLNFDLTDPATGQPDIMCLISTWMIVINPITKFALTLNPVALAVEAGIFPAVSSSSPSSSSSSSPGRKKGTGQYTAISEDDFTTVAVAGGPAAAPPNSRFSVQSPASRAAPASLGSNYFQRHVSSGSTATPSATSSSSSSSSSGGGGYRRGLLTRGNSLPGTSSSSSSSNNWSRRTPLSPLTTSTAFNGNNNNNNNNNNADAGAGGSKRASTTTTTATTATTATGSSGGKTTTTMSRPLLEDCANIRGDDDPSPSSSSLCCACCSRCGADSWLGWLGRVVVRTLLTGLSVALAVTVPQFARVVSMVGSIFSFSVSGIFPSLFYLALRWPSLGCGEKALHISIVAVCTVLAAYGTYGSIFSG